MQTFIVEVIDLLTDFKLLTLLKDLSRESVFAEIVKVAHKDCEWVTISPRLDFACSQLVIFSPQAMAASDPNTKLFGVLGHEITDINTGKIVSIESGSIFNSSITNFDTISIPFII